MLTFVSMTGWRESARRAGGAAKVTFAIEATSHPTVMVADATIHGKTAMTLGRAVRCSHAIKHELQ